MKTSFSLFVFCVFSFCRLFAQQEQALEFLKSEIQRTARQRDEAQKRLLEVESRSADQMKTLSGQQLEIQNKLNESSRDLLQLQANERIARTAIQRAETELAAREKELRELRDQQTASRQEFERVTRDLSAKLAEASLSAVKDPGEDGAQLSEDREKLRQEIQERDRKLTEVDAARQKHLSDLHQLQSKNAELTAALGASQRAEALANAKLAALESRLGNLQQELTQQYQERSDLEQEQERLHGVIQDLQTRLNTAESNRVPRERFDEISRVLEQALAENQELKKEIARRDKVPDLRKDYENIRKQRDLLQAKEKTLLSKVETLEQRLNQADAEKQKEFDLFAAEMEREKEAFRQEALTHRKSVDLLRAELDKQNSSQQIQIRELQNMLGEQLREFTVAERKIEELEARSAQLENVKVQKEQLVKIQTKSREDMRTLAQHIYELRSELVQSKETQRKAILAMQKNKELAGELTAVRAEIEKISRKNDSILNTDDAKEDRIRALRIELETDRARNEALEQEKRELLRDLQDLQQKLSEGSR